MRSHANVALTASVFCALYLLQGCDNDSSSGATPDGTVDASVDVPVSPDGALADGGTGRVLEPCLAPSGAGTEHNSDISTDETWTAEASPHRVTANVRIVANVRIEPCAQVVLSEGIGISVGNTGVAASLAARGERGVDTTGAPLRRAVTFAAADPTKPWGSLTIEPTGRLDLESAVLTDGAAAPSDQNGGGVVLAYGESFGATAPPVTKNVRAVDVTITTSRGFGFNFQRTSGFSDDSAEVTISQSGRPQSPFPIRLEPSAIGTLPTLKLSGNVANEVLIATQSGSMLNDTFKNRGVPYRVSGRLRVAPYTDGAPSKLTIEAGSILKMDDAASDSGIQIGTSDQRQGILVAEGTAAAPILFTSSKVTPVAGDWKNIYFSYSPALGNRIVHSILEYSGGPSGAQGFGCGPVENDATILLLAGRPDEAFIQNVTIRNAAGDTGILCGWVSDLSGPEFLATNTFTNTPACKVSRWRMATGDACPGSVGGSPVCF